MVQRIFFYDTPKNGSERVKFFRAFNGYSFKSGGKVIKKKGFLEVKKIPFYKPNESAIVIDYRHLGIFRRFIREWKIKYRENQIFVDKKLLKLKI